MQVKNDIFASNTDQHLALLRTEQQDEIPNMSTGSIRDERNSTTNMTENGSFPLLRESRTEERGQKSWIRRIFILWLIAFASYIIIDSYTKKNVEKIILKFLQWVADNPLWGLLATTLLIAVGAVLCLPHILLALGNGFVFGSSLGMTTGVTLATLSNFVGSSVGALGAFLLGRYLFQNSAASLMEKYPVFRAVDKAVEGNGFKIMVLLRLSPMPFNVLDYVSGMTSITLQDYSLAMIGYLPNAFVVSFIGASASSLTDAMDKKSDEESETIKTVMLVSAIIFTVASLVATSYYAKKELDKILEAEEMERSLPEDTDEAHVYQRNLT